jgi:hypothetical protein
MRDYTALSKNAGMPTDAARKQGFRSLAAYRAHHRDVASALERLAAWMTMEPAWTWLLEHGGSYMAGSFVADLVPALFWDWQKAVKLTPAKMRQELAKISVKATSLALMLEKYEALPDSVLNEAAVILGDHPFLVNIPLTRAYVANYLPDGSRRDGLIDIAKQMPPLSTILRNVRRQALAVTSEMQLVDMPKQMPDDRSTFKKFACKWIARNSATRAKKWSLPTVPPSHLAAMAGAICDVADLDYPAYYDLTRR